MTQVSNSIGTQLAFDYSALDTDTQSFIKVKAKDIHVRLKRTAEDIVAVGQALIDVKLRLDHGQFGSWLQSEFGMTDRHARNFMNVAIRFSDKTETVSDFPATVLYLLAAPSTPDEIVEQVIAGEIPATKGAIKEAMAEAKESEAEEIAMQNEDGETVHVQVMDLKQLKSLEDFTVDDCREVIPQRMALNIKATKHPFHHKTYGGVIINADPTLLYMIRRLPEPEMFFWVRHINNWQPEPDAPEAVPCKPDIYAIYGVKAG